MSGICGVVQRRGDGVISPDDIISMIRALGMGVEGDGDWVCHPQVGFGSQRIKGAQSGISEWERGGSKLMISFFGNLYNGLELEAGTHDAQNYILSILQLYERIGLEFLSRLRGEFALAIWDDAKQTLYLATDRFRVQPIFYYYDGKELLIFGSRIKAILAGPFSPDRTVDSRAIVDLVARSYIPTPRTIFQEIRKIPPGHVLSFSNGNVELHSYWDINFLNPESGNEDALAAKLRIFFKDALRVRLDQDESQGNIGTFLSGGVDSSTVTGILSQISTRPIKSFSIRFDEQRYNEIHYARIAAQSFGIDHFEYTVTRSGLY